MSHLIRRAAPVLLVAVLGAAVALPAGASQGDGPAASAAKKCKKKKGAAAAKKKKCKKGGGGGAPGGTTLPGQPTPATPQPGGGGSGPGGGDPDPDPDPRLVSDITLTDQTVLGGNETQGEVTIDDPAPAGGQPVVLSDGGSPHTSIPGSVHVAEGETTAGFTVETAENVTAVVGITASISASSAQVNLEIVEEASVESVALDYNCFPDVGLTNFGANRVFLDVPAPSDTDVSLSSSNASELAFPSGPTATVTVPQGTTSALFGVNTLATTPLVTVMGNIPGTTATPGDSASIRDSGSPDPVIAGVSVSPSSVAPAEPSTGTVTLNCEAEAGGSVVTLASSDPTNVIVQPNVTVTQDNLTATFPITTTADASGDVTITATLGGSQQAILTIEDIGT